MAGITGELPCMEIDAGKQCLVVEHLFEVGDEPTLIGRVSCESSTEMVVDAAGGHCIKAEDSSIDSCGVAGALGMAQKSVDRHGLRELRSTSESTVGGVELAE
ncbi:unannotated protein [freshwater metagenome]|uniref:Unannotated protein n=1 Tax=freshwater metagenome TaxID=449393 RepID=A0A6J5YJ11_9ZZZZ